jgi:hypothetical protein
MVGYGIGSLLNIVDFGFFTQAGFIAGSAIFIGVGALKILFSIMGMIQVGFTRNWIFSIVCKIYSPLAIFLRCFLFWWGCTRIAV